MALHQDRRPIAARSSTWARSLAAALAATPITPNQISALSIVWAGAGAALLVWPWSPLAYLGAALCVQGRLLCNLLDGMVAVEGGRQSPLGALYNEFPDRVTDSLLLVALGYACGEPWLGWLGALLAALTAYVRVFGGTLGLPQDFSGIMAKQRRMAVLTVACLFQAVEAWRFGSSWSLVAAAWIVALGSAATCATRSVRLARALRSP